MIGFCQFGAGRIGAIHAATIASRHDARLQFVVDPDRAAAERLAGHHCAAVSGRVEALADPSVNAVVIASSTDTHADLVEAAARGARRQGGVLRKAARPRPQPRRGVRCGG